MNDMGDVEFLLKELAAYLDMACTLGEKENLISEMAGMLSLGSISAISVIIGKRYGMRVTWDFDSDFVKAENSVCSVTVKRERKYKNDDI